MIPQHEIRRNENFHGVDPKELTKINKYFHFRDVLSDQKKELIEKDDVIFQYNFLDSIDLDPVKSKKIF